MSKIQFKLLHPNAVAPKRGTTYSAGYDLFALEDIEITNTPTLIPTGVAVQLLPGTYGRIATRSGLSLKTGYKTLAGVIDLDYKDEIKVMIEPGVIDIFGNIAFRAFSVKKGQAFAQLIIEKIDMSESEIVKEFTNSYGHHEGWGSTDTVSTIPTIPTILPSEKSVEAVDAWGNKFTSDGWEKPSEGWTK